MGMNGPGDLMVLSSIAIKDHAGFHASMNFQFHPHPAASCVLTAVLDWLLFGLLYSFRPLSHFLKLLAVTARAGLIVGPSEV